MLWKTRAAASAAEAKSAVIGYFLKTLALIAAIFSFFSALSGAGALLINIMGVEDGIFPIAIAVASFLASAGLFRAYPRLTRRAKSHFAVSVQEIEDRDSRPPVLYLRSFQADDVTSKSTEILDKTEEEIIADIFGEFGPVVAIGKPGEDLPLPGASRLYVDDAHWKETVLRYMERSSLVILRLGSTMGFWWELSQTAQFLRPEQLVLLTPYDWQQYALFREKAEAYFKKGLPEFVAFGGRLPQPYFMLPPRIGSLRGVIFFNKNWEPEYVDIFSAHWGWRYALNHVARQMLASKLKWALRPVYASLGVSWRPPSIRWEILLIVALGSWFIISGSPLLYAGIVIYYLVILASNAYRFRKAIRRNTPGTAASQENRP